MECTICHQNDWRGRYCRTCGNDRNNPAELSAPGITSLISAYQAICYPRSDGYAAIPLFRQAFRYEDSIPPVVRMVAWFEYAMSFTKRSDYLTLSKSLSTDELGEFIAAIEKVEEIYDSLSEEIKQESFVREYDSLIPGNLNEARRIMQSRSIQKTNFEKTAASRSSSRGGCMLVALIILVLLYIIVGSY